MLSLFWVYGEQNRAWSSLHVASKAGHVEVVRALVDAGINVRRTDVGLGVIQFNPLKSGLCFAICCEG
jgi:hypothetical protein